MDKLRAIEYFVRTADAGSFSEAARQLDVSPPAVTKMVAALERDLGASLLRRASRQVLLTTDGERYIASCRRLLAELREAEQTLSSRRLHARGRLVVGVSRTIALNCIMPHLNSFRLAQPELELDFRSLNYAHEPAARVCDVLLVVGFQEPGDWIARQLGRGRHSVLASPAYWDRHGRPVDPDDLATHTLLAHRVPRGVIIDRWLFSCNGVRKTVATTPAMVFDDRDSQVRAAEEGVGVIFANDLTLLPVLTSGRLELVLRDWIGHEAPPVSLMYRRGAGKSAAVRAFIRFAEEVFADLTRRRAAFGPPDESPMPEWFRTGYVGRLKERGAGARGR